MTETAPSSNAYTVTADLMDAVAAAYDLPAIIHMTAAGERKYYVATANYDYTLYVYLQTAANNQQRYEHWMLTALAHNRLSFSLPVPMRNRHGATFHLTDDGSLWVLTDWLSGSDVQPNDPDQAYAVGFALAELHRALGELQPMTRPDYSDYNFNQRTLPSLRGALPNHPSQLGLNDTPEGNHRLKRFLRLAADFDEPPPPPDSQLHWHIVHGNFFGTNLFYNGERIVGVQGFEHAHPDYRVREMAETLLRVANDLGPLFWGTARAFVEGYAEVQLLTGPEIALVPRFMVEYQVAHVLYYAAAQEPQHAANALRIQEDISAWMEIEGMRLQAMMRGVFLGE